LLGYGFAFENTDSEFNGEEKFSGENWENTDICIKAALYGRTIDCPISAALAERVQPNALVAYSILTMIFTWPVVVAWGWGNGWLNSKFDYPHIRRFNLPRGPIYGKRKGSYDSDSSPLSLYLATMFLVLAMIVLHPASAADTQK
jgi:hypothetical protein